MKKIILFGATGTIGSNVIECLDSQLELVGFSYFRNKEKANNIHRMFKDAKMICLENKNEDDIKSFIKDNNPNLIINAISGWDGLLVSKITLELNIDLALANKETYIIGGELFYNLTKKSKSKIYPIDSEHSSLYELLKIDNENISEIFITASGGSFREKELNELRDIKFDEAIKHPNWSMGEQISLDSSTMINKFYELVEATILTDFKIKVTPIIHKESIVHSFVKYKNNSYLMSTSYPDMKLPIDLSLHNFSKNNPKIKALDFNNLQLNFCYINTQRFIPIKWYYDFVETKNFRIPFIVNVANEWCFLKFKKQQITYLQIFDLINNSLKKFSNTLLIEEWKDFEYLKNKIINWLEEQI